MSELSFCPRCGKPLATEMRRGHVRLVCAGCAYVLYRNPIVGVAVGVLDGPRILLGRRKAGGEWGGKWCIPCGYVEWGEEVRTAARREFLEETGLAVELGDVCAVHSNFHNPASLTVGVWFHGRVTGGTRCAVADLQAVGYFPLDALPEPLAFPTDVLVLEQLRAQATRRNWPADAVVAEIHTL